MPRTGTALAVAAGGALGAVARTTAVALLPESTLPWGTLAVNVAGSFLIGLWAVRVAGGGRAARAVRQHFVMTGFCGGFTTFSALSLELLLMLQAQAYADALIYAVLSAALSIGAAWAGWRAGAPPPSHPAPPRV